MFIVGLLSFPALAVASQSISQGFRAEGSLGAGTIVSYTDEASKLTVGTASVDTKDRLAGVVGRNALVELSDGTTQTQVVTSGETLALVTTINGDVSAGDKIAISPIRGVGMKAIESGPVVGTAQEPFSSANDVHDVEVTDRSGKTQTVKVGLIAVQVAVAHFDADNQDKSVLPDFILQLARSISGGREVSVMRVVIAMVVLLAGILVIGTLVYASVRSSIVSIGRNPLAAKAVHRSLFEVAGMAIGILLVMLIAVYLVLVI